MAVCEYCKQEVASGYVVRHAVLCIRHPGTAARVREFLHSLSPKGIVPSSRHYRSVAQEYPSVDYLVKELGSWDAVAEWAGLMPRRYASPSVVLAESKARLVKLANDYHGGVYGPNRSEYDDWLPEYLLDSLALEEKFDTWAAVLTWAGGYRFGEPIYYECCRLEREMAEKAARLRALRLRRKLDKVERKLMDAAEIEVSGLAVNGEPKERQLYDFRTHTVYECVVTELR